jgi:hypothetical protein
VLISSAPPPAIHCQRFVKNPMCHPLPAHPHVSPYSAAWVRLQAQPGQLPMFVPLAVGIMRKGDHNDAAFPVYHVTANGIEHIIRCQGVPYSAAVCAKNGVTSLRIRIPADAYPEGNEDRHLTIEDDANRSEIDFWGASFPDDVQDSPFDTLSAGQCSWDSDGTDCSGSTATNIASTLGLIDPREVKSAESDPHGTLPSAIATSALCASPTWVYPATYSDGANTNATPACKGALGPNGRPPEGSRYFLDLSDAEVNATPNAPYVKVILRTLDREHYGGTITDTNWSGAPGLALQFIRDGWSAITSERPLFARGLPITTTGIDLTKTLRFCDNGTCGP